MNQPRLLKSIFTRAIFYSAGVLLIIILISSCSTLEKSSLHGFHNGYYKTEDPDKNAHPVYVDITEENINVYDVVNDQPDTAHVTSIPMVGLSGQLSKPVFFTKQSLDIDITSILFKYRPSVYGLPEQLTTDFNLALYAGWRHDKYTLRKRTDPLGRSYTRISNRGYDLGVFAGPGTTVISPFTTKNRTENEYSGMILQSGVAGFIESDMASFGIALGYDFLLNHDRDIWIYNNKPWIGFVIGIALN